MQRLCTGLLMFHASESQGSDQKKLRSLTRASRRSLPDIKTLAQRYSLPPALQRKQKKRDLASALAVYNLVFSNFHRLPWELVLEIVSYMATVDRIVFKLLCRRHTSIQTRQITEAESKDLTRRLQHDAFEALAAAELPNASLLSRMLCCSCKVPHPNSSFFQADAKKPADKRKCIGAAGTFRFCRHRDMDFKYFRSLCSDRKEGQFVEPGCYECHFRKEFDGQAIHPSISRNSDGDMQTFRVIVHKKHWSTGGMLRAELHNHVCKLSILICPHTKMNDRSILVAIMGTSGRRQIPEWFVRPGESNFVAWTCSFCDSTVFIGRVVRKSQGFLVAGVCRNLGQMEEAMDPKWLAHLEEDRQRPYSKYRPHNLKTYPEKQTSPSGAVTARRAWEFLTN